MAMASLYQLEQKQLSALYDSLPRERRHLLIKQAQEYLESLDKAITRYLYCQNQGPFALNAAVNWWSAKPAGAASSTDA